MSRCTLRSCPIGNHCFFLSAQKGRALVLVQTVGYCAPMFFLAAILAVANVSEAACDSRVTVTVVDASNRSPVRGAEVQLSPADTNTPELTNDQGRLAWDALCAGEHVALATTPDGATAQETFTLQTGQSDLEIEIQVEPKVDPDVEEVVVTGKAEQRQTVQPEATLQGHELEALRGASLGEALQLLPGVSAIRTGSIYVPIIHGMFASRVALFNDGVRHFSQNWGLDHAPEVDPFAAERIRVVKGAAGVRYGPEAIGGAILVEPHPYPTDTGLSGESYLIGETNGRAASAALRFRGRLAALPQLAWRMRLSTEQAADLTTPDYVLDNTGAQNLNGSVGVSWQQEQWGAEAEIDHFSSDLGTFTGAASATANLEEFNRALSRSQPRDADIYEVDREINRPSQEVTHTLVKARGWYGADEDNRVTVTASYQFDDREEFALVRETIEGPQQDFELDTGMVDLHYRREDMSLTEALTVNITAGAVGMVQSNQVSGTDIATIPDYDAWGLGLYAYSEASVGDFTFELGGRYDRRSITVFEPETLAFDAPIISENFSFDAGALTLGSVWNPRPGLELHLDISSAARTPSALEQFTDGRVPGLPALVRGDRNLAVETAWNTSLGAAYGADWGRVQITTYATFVNDYIYFAPFIENGEPLVSLTIRGALPLFAYRQVDALLLGGEASVELNLGPWFDWETSGSYVRGRNTSDGEALLFVPPARIQNSLRFRLPWEGWFRDSYVSVSSVVVFEQTDFEPSTDFSPPPEGFHLLGFGAGTQVDLGEQVLSLTANVENATNTTYRNYPSLIRYFADEPGISFILRAGLEFSI